ncbi:MAG TPA: sigma-70 family RNA polymerase sigma factor [Thermoanaerobaculia bacterium]|jgi:RNA polymerase sigma-70 factor (ECF subfamily)
MMMRKGGRGRDHELFTELYARYYRRMLRFFMHGFRLPAEDAHDLVQDTFVRFYESMDEYRGDAEWALLELIGRNVALNRIRALGTAKRNAKTVDIDDPKAFDEPAALPEPDYAEREELASQRKRLHDAIASLPAGQRQCMQLWLEDFKYDEIARTLRITLDAVRSRLRDARRELQSRIGLVLPEEKE